MRSLLLISVATTLSAILPAMAADKPVRSVEFTSTPAPASDDEMTIAYTRSQAVVTYADGSTATFPLRYDVLMHPGDTVKGGEIGLVVDKAGKPVMQAKTDNGAVVAGPFRAYAPDANSLIETKAGPRLVTHYEYHTEGAAADGKPVNLYRQLPMLMSAASLKQDTRTGKLSVTDAVNVDFSGTEGLWVPCAGTLTPWNTHLGSEEYEPNARLYQSKPLEAMNLYLNTPGKLAAEGGAKPYRYGHLVEVDVSSGKPVATKHYATGRLAFELADVQEDGRTLYYGDDGRDVALFMFVADRVADLSAGTLYAAKWNQIDGANGGKAQLSWIRLGHAVDGQIKALVDNGIAFSDIFEIAAGPAEGFRPVYVYGGAQPSEKAELEYLKLKPGMEQAAAFLESRRYAAYRGATTEFTKMEGQTHDPKGRKLFTAMSYVEQGMLDGKNGSRPTDDVRLTGDEKDLACGIVYESTLSPGQYDSEGRQMGSDWVATEIKALVTGSRKGASGNKYDKCDTDKVANPDNLKFSPAMGTLFIGEDSGNHINNFLWAYNAGSNTLSRIFSAPAGGENTGLAVVEKLGGHAYILANVQHPGAAADLGKYPTEIKLDLRKKIDQRGIIGYLGGLPSLK